MWGDGEDGCGNAVPMETKKRFPQGLANLAQYARLAHFHSRSSSLRKEKTKNEDFCDLRSTKRP
jgi:hypothetical protein